MRCGVNLTSPSSLAVIKRLLDDGEVDFCEILVDNFLHLDPKMMCEFVGDVPVGFHIMWSRFLERDDGSLVVIAKRLRCWIDALAPVYVSDHVAQFTVEGRLLPLLAEIEYGRNYSKVRDRVLFWQDLLGVQILLENFPSSMDDEGRQIEFYTRLLKETQCALLFDCSNAVVAEINCQVDASGWLAIASEGSNYHIAGFRKTQGDPLLAIDTHDVPIVERSLEVLSSIAASRPGGWTDMTVVIERDANIEFDSWADELRRVRALEETAVWT